MWGRMAKPAEPVSHSPRYLQQVRIEQFLSEAMQDWQGGHTFHEWVLLEDKHVRSIYARALVDFVDTLVAEHLKDEDAA